ncbi:ABC transporter ATP-binding protein [Dethiosulfovibrio sp. F2B]|uniref:ABC transporter ATP-binding protein n=1 Tax=Dethiosulfovibrio faecalis TaxID=2720018 RepID=UPI001F23B4DE|nr:ABC transporter ATP-binding protein [Dethiosulfovibrio faecalis]MCF4152293.1 ABC transporter ATP-binding protein [Dethiosulfovibrio faecalis]
MNSPYLTVRNLKVRYGSRELVKGISLDAYRGRVLGILGESGCGKSLTCLGILGLLPPGLSSSGKIAIEGKSTAESREYLGSSITSIMQSPVSCFDPVYTVGNHFTETLKAHDISDHSTVVEALEEVGLSREPRLLDLYPFQMSGGMLQRVMIALALVTEAPFIVADEPTTDLDAINQTRILTLLGNLVSRKNLGMIMVTHDLGVLAKMADDVVVMKDGVMVDSGTVEDLFDHPGSDYTAELIEAHMKLSGETEGILS